MAKTNGCLVAGICTRYFIGMHACAYTCDVEYLESIESLVLTEIYAELIKRVPSYMRKRALEHLKGLYFPTKEELDGGNFPVPE